MKCIRERNKKEGPVTYIILAEPSPAAQTANNQNEKQLETQVNEMASSVLYDRNKKKTKKGPYSLYSALQVMYRAYSAPYVLLF